MRPRRPTTGIMSGRRDRDVEVGEAILDALGEILGADDVGAGLLGLARLVALGEDGDRDALAQAVGQRDRAAQLLVGVADVEARCARGPRRTRRTSRAASSLTSWTASAGSCSRSRSTLPARLPVGLAVPGHLSTTSTPIERAVPAMIFAAWSTSCALRSGSLLLGDLAQLRRADRADLVAVRLARALVEARGLLDEHRGRRRLRDERERAVLVDRDDDRDDRAGRRPASGR